MNKFLTILFTGLIAIGLSACASVFGDKNRDVQVTSNPAGATVYYNNQEAGHTPTTIQVDSTWGPKQIVVKKQGYEPAVRTVQTSFQPIGILNVLFWPGFIVDAATGNMVKIQPNVNIDMQTA